jgi:hypothetical protein
MFAKEARRADDNVQTGYTRLYGQLGIPHIAADVWQKIRQEGPPNDSDSRVKILALGTR